MRCRRHHFVYTQGYFYCTKCGRRKYSSHTGRRKNKKIITVPIIVVLVIIGGFFVYQNMELIINDVNPIEKMLVKQIPNFNTIPTQTPIPRTTITNSEIIGSTTSNPKIHSCPEGFILVEGSCSIAKPSPLPTCREGFIIKITSHGYNCEASPQPAPKIAQSPPPQTIPQATTQYSLDELKQIALDDINKYRTQNGVNPISLGNAKSPQLYAEELLKEGCIHHIDSKGQGPMLRYKTNGDTMFLIWENISGQPDSSLTDEKQQILAEDNQMMFDDANSNWGHKDNMLNPNHSSVSIGIAWSGGRLFMVQDFQQSLPAGYEYDPSSFQTQPMDAKIC